GDPADVLNKLEGDFRRWPLVNVLPAQSALYRALDLPPVADDAAAQRMTELRLATMFPLEDGKVQWGFRNYPASVRTWVTPVRSTAIEQMPTLPAPFAQPIAAVAMEMAVAARVLDHDPAISLLILTSTESHAAVVVLSRGSLHGVEQAD